MSVFRVKKVEGTWSENRRKEWSKPPVPDFLPYLLQWVFTTTSAVSNETDMISTEPAILSL